MRAVMRNARPLVAVAALVLAACRAAPTPEAVQATWRDVMTIVAAGDIADCANVAAAESAAARTAALVRPDDALVLTVGDNTYPDGAPAEFTDCFEPTWGRFAARLRPAPGNHEYRTPGAAGYFAYFGERAGPDRRGYYSFDLPGWHVVSLNSNVDATTGSAQFRWLVDDLRAASGVSCVLAVWHHPVFSSGPHGNDMRMRDALAALHAAGADIVLVGHDHVYERMAPHDADGRADPQGVRSFTVGTGGARLYRFKQPHPLSVARDASSHGVLRLTLGDGGYRWEFVPVGGGAPRDVGEAVCRRKPPPG